MRQRRIFAFLWPDPPPGAVDGQARQDRYLRICPRGPLRLALLITLTLATFCVAFLGTLALTVYPSAIAAALSLLTIASVLAITLRGWQIGTYVNDDGLRIIRALTTRTVPWTDVRSLRDGGGEVIVDTDTTSVTTHVHRRGLDHITSDDSFDMARDRLNNWWRRA